MFGIMNSVFYRDISNVPLLGRVYNCIVIHNSTLQL